MVELEQIKQKYPPYDYSKDFKKSKCIDMSNKKFGKLTVLYRYFQNSSNRQARWVCQCECGNISIPAGASLRNGRTTSCGCQIYQNAAKSNIRNLMGQRFGKLTVLKDSGKRKNHRVIWICQCDCGEIVERISDSLVQGDTISCGKCTQSIGANAIEDILKSNNIQYQKEKKFSDLLGKNKIPYRYDFYLPDFNRLIEFDGIQHFKKRTIFKDSLEVIQKRDKEKDLYALKNNISLVRIPYWEQNNLSLEMLLGNDYLIGDELNE